MPSIRPDAFYETLFDVPLTACYERGVRCLLVDVDNTLARWNELSVPAAAREWAARAKGMGFSLVLVSNNHRERMRPFMEALEVEGVANARKPWPSAFRRVAEAMGVPPGACLMIGDQLVTDIIGAKAAGMRAVLVLPIDRTHEFWGTRLNRQIEWLLLKLMGIRPPKGA